MAEKTLINIMRDFENNYRNQMEELKLGHSENRKELEYVKGTTTRIESKLDDFIKCADKKYAPRWVAEAIKWTIGVVMFAVLGALLAKIIT